jgi:phenylacetate-coenzyme A ligase PaaK-like adenylate-forming protein
VLTKAMLMERFDDVVTDRAIRMETVRAFAAMNVEARLYLDRYHVSATSGSGGHPGFFLFDEREFLSVIASFARGQEWSGAKVNPLRPRTMATVASTSPWHISSQVSATVKSGWIGSAHRRNAPPGQGGLGRRAVQPVRRH